jgi:hypothetical protein
LAFAAFFTSFAYGQNIPASERTALPSKGLLWGSKMTIESQPCCTPATGSAKPVMPSDSAVIAKLSDRAQRDGTVLRLKLQGGKSLKITDCDDEGACEADRFRKHRLVGWWPSLGYYVVLVGLYEESMAYLVSEKDGRTTQVAAPPILSPSGRMAVALVSNLMAGVDLNIIDLTVEPPKVIEVADMPTCAGAGDSPLLRPKPVWVDDDHIRFEGVSPQPGANPNTKQLLRLGAGAPRWEC